MKLEFRIDWGYQYLYSRRHYHPFYHWDGHLECSDGTIEKVFRLDYPVLWFGPGHSAKETQLESPCWKSTTHRGFAGIRIEADVADSAVIDPSREVFWNEWVEEGSVRRLQFQVVRHAVKLQREIRAAIHPIESGEPVHRIQSRGSGDIGGVDRLVVRPLGCRHVCRVTVLAGG